MSFFKCFQIFPNHRLCRTEVVV